MLVSGEDGGKGHNCSCPGEVTVLVVIHWRSEVYVCTGGENHDSGVGARCSQLLGSHLQVCKNVQECKYIININDLFFLSFYLSFMWTIFLFLFTTMSVFITYH